MADSTSVVAEDPTAERYPGLPWEHPNWQGPICCMCGGTGRDAFSHVVTCEGDLAGRVIGYYLNGMYCRACNGHGRDAS